MASRIYTKVFDVLRDYPDLRPIHEELRSAPVARDYSKERHDAALQAWQGALAERGIRLEFRSGSVVGYGATDLRTQKTDEERQSRNRAGVKRLLREIREKEEPS